VSSPAPTAASSIATTTLAHRLAVIPFALFLAFGAAVLAGSLPLAPLDPLWQLRVCTLLVDNAALPLLGLVLLHLAVHVQPGGRLQARRDAAARWAVAAACGFLLLLPLQAVAAWRVYSTAGVTQNQQLATAQQRLTQIRQAIDAAATPQDLQTRLQALRGPVLGPVDLAQPMPKLRQRLLAALAQAERRLGDQLQGLNPAGLWALIQRALRLTIASLGFALAFAAAGQRRNREFSLLQEWQMARARRRQYGTRRSPTGSSPADSDRAYFRSIGPGKDKPGRK
jgi:hypothetical protein